MDKLKIDSYPCGKNILLIFTGRGGTTSGFDDKYKKIADRVVQKYGFSVCVCATPENVWDCPEEIFSSALEEVCLKLGGTGDVYVMGSSAGANLALWYSKNFSCVKRVLAVNPVLNLNFHNTRSGLEGFKGEKLTVAVGELDPSALWLNALKPKENVKTMLIKGADHVFKGRLEEFVALADILFD